MNIRQFYRDYVLALQKYYASAEALHIAELAIEHITKYRRMDWMKDPSLEVTSAQMVQLDKMLIQLQTYYPIQYIIGHTWFYHLRFKVNESVLIPRPETEELADYIIRSNQEYEGLRVLDVGTGSGCLAITLKKFLKDADVTAVDVSKDALEVAQQNAEENQAEVHFLQMDFLNEINRTSLDPFDIIVSNPPYIPFEEKDRMDKNVVDYEPHLALFAEDHLIFYKAIAAFAEKKLRAGGRIYLETHQDYAQDVAIIFKQKFDNVTVLKDISGNERFVVVNPNR